MKVGETLAGRYELRQFLSSGRSTLFIAHDRRADRLVAVKVFDVARASPDDLRRYAARLAEATKVIHPAVVVPQVQIAVSESPPFVVGELLQGEDLGSLCARLKVVPWGRAVVIARTCAEGLSALVDATGGAHRALRPGNVWLARDGQPQILDFGVAELGMPLVRARPDGVFVEYRAPEQLEGAPGDVRSDVFSLGVLLFEMVTGVHPFSGSSAAAVAIKILTQPAPTLTQLAPHVQLPAPLAELLRRALARRPKDRFSDTASMAREFDALLPAAASVGTDTPPTPRHEAPIPHAVAQPAQPRAQEPRPALQRILVDSSESQSFAAGHLRERNGRAVDPVPLEDRTVAMPRGGRSGQAPGERTEVLPPTSRANREPAVERTELLPPPDQPTSMMNVEHTGVLPDGDRPGRSSVDDDARTQTLRRIDRPAESADEARTQVLQRQVRPSLTPNLPADRTQAFTRLDGRAPRPGDETLLLPGPRAAGEATEILPRRGDDELPVHAAGMHASAGEMPGNHESQPGPQGPEMAASVAVPARDDGVGNWRRLLIVLNLVLVVLLVAGLLWLRG